MRLAPPFGKKTSEYGLNRPLRVCMVSPLYHTSLGGVGSQALALTEKLGAFGIDLFVIARKMKGFPEYTFSNKIPIYRVWCLRPHIHNLVEMSLLNLITSLSFCFSTAFILLKKRKKYDIVHFHGASLFLILNIFILKLCGKKIFAKVAGPKLAGEAGDLKGRYALMGKVAIWMLKKVDCFIATSARIEEGLLNEGYDRRRIVRISNFIDKDIFFPADKKSRAHIKKELSLNKRKIVTYAGRLIESKGVHVLLESWKKITKDSSDIFLIILGRGHLEKKLKEQSRILGIEESIKFCGSVNNVRDYLIATDFFVLPSFREGFPNSVLEAMACGLPVISTKIGGVVDVINNGKNGILVEPGNVNQLEDAIKKLTSDKDYARVLGKNALKTIREKYDINIIVKKYIELYARCIYGSGCSS